MVILALFSCIYLFGLFVLLQFLCSYLVLNSCFFNNSILVFPLFQESEDKSEDIGNKRATIVPVSGLSLGKFIPREKGREKGARKRAG